MALKAGEGAVMKGNPKPLTQAAPELSIMDGGGLDGVREA